LHDGAFVFGRALLIRPFSSKRGVHGVVEWNDPSLWKCKYELQLRDYVFFAEDAVGFSYCLGSDHRVYFFDPEQGALEFFTDSVESWLELISRDPGQVGASLAASWVAEHGEIPFGYRIPPVVPFIVKESESIGKMLAPELALAKYRAALACSVSDAVDDEQIQIQSVAEYLREQQ